ncbi:MAG: subclass B3 metallo-beta-lactamase [Gammaproteobacteria bacterium]|nr:subclass B3 metallo-beta-lactamase [Gammaproteobacteria bacterium]
MNGIAAAGAAALFVTAGAACADVVPDPPLDCPQCADWNRTPRAFRVYGNTYYVGTSELSAILIATDAGLILIDGALPQTAPLIDTNLRALGFDVGDVRLILNSHAHHDHVGGLAVIQRASDARVAASPSSAAALRSGRPTPDDPQATSASFPSLADVDEIADRDTLSLGTFRITAHFTPGHTPGGTTWTWTSCEDARCLDVVFADSLNAVSMNGFRFTGDASHPSLVDVFRRSIRRVEELPCAILLSPHAGFFRMEDKLHRREAGERAAFIDEGACRAYAAAASRRLDERIADELKASP